MRVNRSERCDLKENLQKIAECTSCGAFGGARNNKEETDS